MRLLILLLVLITALFSCKKNGNYAGEKVEIYLLDTYRMTTGKCQVDPASAKLQSNPMISNDDIRSYSAGSYEFTITGPAHQRVKALRDGTPFAVTVDQQVVYYGIFKPSISSSSCDHSITMDVSWTGTNKIFLRLGYPEGLPGGQIDDQRNAPGLLAALVKQNKLN